MEPVSSLTSTKACIPEYKILETVETRKRRKKEDLAEMRRMLESQGLTVSEYEPVLHRIGKVAPGSIVLPEKLSGRMKVVDCIQDFLCRYSSTKTVLDVANWNIVDNDSRAVADVCIKAQYGAKREFYVINLGAKCMLRVVENAYKTVAKEMSEEMISCPGDSKLKFISEVSDYSIKWSPDRGFEQYFVNGDCTKWSASETMSSFLNFNEGMRGCLGESLTDFCNSVFSSWANKTIRFPMELVMGTSYITEKNEYLRAKNGIHSTQNFLQGMFNYTSSVKSCAATRMAILLWKIHKGSLDQIMVRQLGHSDDYLLVIRAREQRVLIEFRRYHKLMQRLVGITDSSKKTNIQRHVMEFISLFSFNGQMVYPNIKKTKETGLNIGSEGYQRDIMTVCSRAGESIRLGVPIKSAYIQQRLHCISMYRAYGLAEGMRNEIPPSLDPFNTPISLFGLPDCLPILYINSYCDVNNIRLARHCNKSKEILSGLVELASKYVEIDPISILDVPLTFVPQYIYKKTGGSIKAIREKLQMTREDVEDFYESYPEYKVMKPNHPALLLPWIHNLYYNNSFSKAYAMVSRPSLLLRLSYFVSNACIATPWLDKPLRIKDYYWDVISRLDGKNFHGLQEHLSCYNANPILMYELLDGCELIKTSFLPHSAQAMHLPKPIKHIKICNSVESVIQYMISEERMKMDCRTLKNPSMLLSDIKAIEDISGVSRIRMFGADLIKLYSVLKSQTTQSKYGIGYSSASDKSCMVYMESWLSHGIDPRNRYSFIHSETVSVKNPISGVDMFERSYGMHTNYSNIVIENVTQLYFLLCVKEGWSVDEFKEVITSLKLEKGELLEILKNTPIDHSDTRDFLHKRMFAFFRYIICGDRSDLTDMVNSILFYRYKFLDKRKEHLDCFLQCGISFEDGVFIRYQDENFFIGVSDSKTYAVTDCRQLTKIGYAYSVGQMLLRKKTAENHIQAMENGLIYEIDMVSGLKGPGFVKTGVNIRYVNEIAGEPSFAIIQQRVPSVVGLLPKKGHEHDISIDYKGASIYSYKMLLFRLSIMSCGQHSVVKSIKGYIRGISLQSLIDNGVLYWYLNGHSTCNLADFDASVLKPPESVSILDMINMRKPDIDFSVAKKYLALKEEEIKIFEDKPKSYGFDLSGIRFLDESGSSLENCTAKAILGSPKQFGFDMSGFSFNASCESASQNSEGDHQFFDEGLLMDPGEGMIASDEFGGFEQKEVAPVYGFDLGGLKFDTDDFGMSMGPKESVLEDKELKESENSENIPVYGFDLGHLRFEPANLGLENFENLETLHKNSDSNSMFDGDELRSLGYSDTIPDSFQIAESDIGPTRYGFDLSNFSLESGDALIQKRENMGEIEWDWEIKNFNVENTRGAVLFWDGEELQDDLEADYAQSSNGSNETSSDSSDDDGPFFYNIKLNTNNKTFSSYAIKKTLELPSIENYLIMQYIGFDRSALLQSPKLLRECIKFSYTMELMKSEGFAFTKKERLTGDMVSMLLYQAVSENLFVDPRIDDDLWIESTSNCRLIVRQASTYSQLDRAMLMAEEGTTPKETDNGFTVRRNTLLSVRKILTPPVKLSDKIFSTSFKQDIIDIEKTLNDFLEMICVN